MGLGLLLLPALGGYLFLRFWNRTRYYFLLSPGYHLVFQSAASGLVLFFVSLLAVVWFDWKDGGLARGRIARVPIEPKDADALLAALLSVAVGIGVTPLLNLFFPREKCARRAARRFGRHREIFIHDSIRSGPVEISTRTGKCYVAEARKIEMALPGDSDVVVTPWLSGYRDSGTRELRITTHYIPLLGDPPDPGRLPDLRVVVPISEIVSVRPFDLEIYEKFRDPRPGDSGA